ncbi:hypothetical protein AOLI_G00184510 [Acnodon oligacanthus]
MSQNLFCLFGCWFCEKGKFHIHHFLSEKNICDQFNVSFKAFPPIFIQIQTMFLHAHTTFSAYQRQPRIQDVCEKDALELEESAKDKLTKNNKEIKELKRSVIDLKGKFKKLALKKASVSVPEARLPEPFLHQASLTATTSHLGGE